MKMVRKVFRFPQDGIVELEVEGFWTSTKRKVQKSEPVPFWDVVQQVQDFASSIGPERLVSISEYTEAKEYLGDDGITNFVVWYWEATSPEPTAN